MLVVLEAVSGPVTGRRIEVRAGSILSIGRTTRADYAIGEDSYLSSLHFAVECDGVQCRVRDMGSSNGTFVNGNRVTEDVVKDGDSLAAGESAFTIHVELSASAPPAGTARGDTATAPMFGRPAVPTTIAPLPPPPLPSWPGYTRGQSILLSALFGGVSRGGTVYAVLDAARDARIAAFLEASGEPHVALHPQVFVAAPYPQGRLLDVLIKDGWGRGWGYFFVSTFSLEEVCRHLHNYITLYTGAGRPLTFRFWDPRILRALAPALPPGEAADFFGPLSRIVVEGEKPEVAVELSLTPRGPQQQTLLLV